MPSWLFSIVFVVEFVLLIWIALLWLGRQAVRLHTDLKARVESWASSRGWQVSEHGPYLLLLLAQAERAPASVHGELAGRPCTILYCEAAENTYTACCVRLRGGTQSRRACDRALPKQTAVDVAADRLRRTERRVTGCRVIQGTMVVTVRQWIFDDELDRILTEITNVVTELSFDGEPGTTPVV